MASVRFLECLAHLFAADSHGPCRNDLYANLDQGDPAFFGMDTLAGGECASLGYSSADDSDHDLHDHDHHGSSDGGGGDCAASLAPAAGAAGHGCAMALDQPARLGGAARRRRSSISRVAWRWRLTAGEAQELCETFESQQGAGSPAHPPSRELSAVSFASGFGDVAL